MKHFSLGMLLACSLGCTAPTIYTQHDACPCTTKKTTCGCARRDTQCADAICRCIETCGFCDCAHDNSNELMLHAPMSYGDIIDRITILEIKEQEFTDEQKLANVRRELAFLYEELEKLLDRHPEKRTQILSLKQKLFAVNKAMWDIEDDIRAKEARQTFDETFIELARGVYHTNDSRCAIKRAINVELDSPLVEEKQYTQY